MYWAVQPQYFFTQMTSEKGKWRSEGQDPQAETFKRIVTKEPKYNSPTPFRGVVKFGTQDYAFALDTAPPKAKQPDKKELSGQDKEKTAAGTKPAKKDKGKKADEAAPPSLADFAYSRLYFDANHNGDLTDDKVIELPADSGALPGIFANNGSYGNFNFPRTDITLDVGGTKVDYSFSLDGYVYSGGTNCYVRISFTSAICREGDITLDGKRHHIVVLDNNSNGRFDDVNKISQNVHMASGQLYAEGGDMLLIDPQPGGGFDSPYDASASEFRYPVAELIEIGGKCYDLTISPAGDKLTLTPSDIPLGSVTNGNDSFRALIYREGKGFFKIRGTKNKPVPVPEGEWKLYSYTINHVDPPPKPAKEKEKAADEKAKGSLWAIFTGGGVTAEQPAGPSLVAATATDKYKAVTVRQGQTVEFPFGPPYKPAVIGQSFGAPDGKAQQLYLRLTLVGIGGEECTNMEIKGNRPGKPEFTITDPDKKVVQQGTFEYG